MSEEKITRMSYTLKIEKYDISQSDDPNVYSHTGCVSVRTADDFFIYKTYRDRPESFEEQMHMGIDSVLASMGAKLKKDLGV